MLRSSIPRSFRIIQDLLIRVGNYVFISFFSTHHSKMNLPLTILALLLSTTASISTTSSATLHQHTHHHAAATTHRLSLLSPNDRTTTKDAIKFLAQERFATRAAARQQFLPGMTPPTTGAKKNNDIDNGGVIAESDAAATGGAALDGATKSVTESATGAQEMKDDVTSNGVEIFLGTETGSDNDNEIPTMSATAGSSDTTTTLDGLDGSSSSVVAVACEPGPWSDWSSCSRKCSLGTETTSKGIETRSRAVLNLNKLNMQQVHQCPPLMETQVCYPPSCPMPCRVSNWTVWSGCEAPCENLETESRTRFVEAESQREGKECPPLMETRGCNANKCPKPVANCTGEVLRECTNNGVCTLEGCQCFPGFTLIDCSGVLERDCLNDCSGHGKCRTADATCVCDSGYGGEDCSVGECPNQCNGHGTCMSEPQL